MRGSACRCSKAMDFGPPVVVHGAGAVAETIGGAGLVLGRKDALVWAEAFGRVIDGGELRQEPVSAGRRRLRASMAATVRRGCARRCAGSGCRPGSRAQPAVSECLLTKRPQWTTHRELVGPMAIGYSHDVASFGDPALNRGMYASH